ncbi:MAG TPA: SDR family oxidoreductase [Baekduia sp.]|nr:SDR family oxidoreductase [Baekduia sp.]
MGFEPTSRFSGRVILVTGGGSGIGLAIARRFAAEGARVVLLGRDGRRLAEAAADIGSDTLTQPCDISDRDGPQAAVDVILDRLGRIDVLINNAGNVAGGPVLEETVESLNATMATDVAGTLLMSQSAARAMSVNDGGVIINNGSVYARAGAVGALNLSVAKSAIVAMTRTMAIEFAPLGIRVNAVSPGWVDLEEKMTRYFGADTLAYMRGSFERTPLRRLVHPDEVAATFAFLASDDASAITGQEIVVDAGLSANLFVQETLPVPS